MNTRRKFIIQGGMATTAMLALKPFNAIANAASPFTGINTSYGNLVFLHTSSLNPNSDSQVIRYIKGIKNSNANAILLKAGQDAGDETGQLDYDVTNNGGNVFSIMTDDYKIIKKGNIKTGVISAKQGDNDVIQKVNTLSAYLKKEKNCKVVVCLSQLGYKNRNTPDDITLAKKSTHLDIIIGGNTKNFQQHPMIALNSNNAEVIIHSAAGKPAVFGKIEVDFNDKGQKKYISVTNKLSNNPAPDRAMPAA